MVAIPYFRAKSNERKNTYIEGLLIGVDEELNLCTIRTKDDYIGGEVCYLHTLSINFPDMLDSQGNKIFASLSEDRLAELEVLEHQNKSLVKTLEKYNEEMIDLRKENLDLKNSNNELLEGLVSTQKRLEEWLEKCK